MKWKMCFFQILMMVMVVGAVENSARIASAQIITKVERQGSQNAPPQIAEPFGEFAWCYVDRTDLYADLPPELPELIGAQYIITADNDKNVDNLTLDVTFSSAAKVYLILDNRMGETAGGKYIDPILDDELSWVATLGFTDTGFDIGIDASGDGSIDHYSSLFRAELPAGTHTFGEQHNGVIRNMYGIVAVPSVSAPISAIIDIKPDTLNRKSQGRWITCYLWLPEEYNVFDIVPSSIHIDGGIPAARTEIDKKGEMLTIKFPCHQIKATLEPGEVTLKVTGHLVDGTGAVVEFEGIDTIRVIK